MVLEHLGVGGAPLRLGREGHEMTIDINELRMLTQDFKLAGLPMFLQTTQMNELLDRLEAAEKSDAESMAMYRRVRGGRDALRAKVEAMEKQLPVKYEFQGRDGKWYPFIDQRHYENTVADGTWPIRSLYALPGAQNVPSVPACADIMDAARYRWLRKNGLAHEKRESRAVLPRGGKKASMAFRYWTTPEELDMAIDAMIAAAPEAKP